MSWTLAGKVLVADGTPIRTPSGSTGRYDGGFGVIDYRLFGADGKHVANELGSPADWYKYMAAPSRISPWIEYADVDDEPAGGAWAKLVIGFTKLTKTIASPSVLGFEIDTSTGRLATPTVVPQWKSRAETWTHGERYSGGRPAHILGGATRRWRVIYKDPHVVHLPNGQGWLLITSRVRWPDERLGDPRFPAGPSYLAPGLSVSDVVAFHAPESDPGFEDLGGGVGHVSGPYLLVSSMDAVPGKTGVRYHLGVPAGAVWRPALLGDVLLVYYVADPAYSYHPAPAEETPTDKLQRETAERFAEDMLGGAAGTAEAVVREYEAAASSEFMRGVHVREISVADLVAHLDHHRRSPSRPGPSPWPTAVRDYTLESEWDDFDPTGPWVTPGLTRGRVRWYIAGTTAAFFDQPVRSGFGLVKRVGFFTSIGGSNIVDPCPWVCPDDGRMLLFARFSEIDRETAKRYVPDPRGIWVARSRSWTVLDYGVDFEVDLGIGYSGALPALGGKVLWRSSDLVAAQDGDSRVPAGDWADPDVTSSPNELEIVVNIGGSDFDDETSYGSPQLTAPREHACGEPQPAMTARTDLSDLELPDRPNPPHQG
jgi:hypothetical protein